MALVEPKWVRGYLPEPQMGRVQEGMPASVISDSYPDRPFAGWVGFISPTAEFTPKSVQTTDLRTQLVYEVRVWVQDPENELRLGTPVTVRIDTTAPRIAPKLKAGSRATEREAGKEGA
jgi:HlyD family secretion protein